jgi:phage-related protein
MSDGKIKIGTEINDAQLKQQLNKMSGNMNKMLKAVSFTSVVVGAVVVGKAVGNMVSEVVDAGDNIDKMSQKVGLSKKAYQEWDYVMGQSGMSIDTLKVGMNKFNKEVLDDKDSFKQLGLEVDSFDSKDELFDATIVKLSEMGDTMERAKIANELFGKAGAEMAPLLNTSTESIEALKKEANDLGIVISDETIDSSVNLADAVDKLKNTFSGLLSSSITPLLPVITDLANKLSEILPHLMDFIAPLLSMLIPALGEIVKALLPPLLALFEALLPILQPLIDILLLLCNNVLVPLITLFSEIIVNIMPSFVEILIMLVMALTPVLEVFGELIYILMPVLIKVFKFVIENIVSNFKESFESIMPVIFAVLDALKNLIDFIVKIFQGDWRGAWESIGKFFVNIWDGVKLAFAHDVNMIIRGINKIIGGLNELNFKLPVWLGGGEFSVNIKEIQEMKIETSGNYQERANKLFKGSDYKIPDSKLEAEPKKDYKVDKALGGDLDISSLLEGEGYDGIKGEGSDIASNLVEDITGDDSFGGSNDIKKVVNMRNIYIDVTGNKFSDEMDINKTGDLLVQRLKLAGVL